MSGSQETTPASQLRQPSRYITDTNAEAKAVFSLAVDAPLGEIVLGASVSRFGYATPSPAPLNLNGSPDVQAYATKAQSGDTPPLVAPGGGSTAWYVDMPPGSSSPMHRTVSIDLVVQIEGEIELHLDGGEMRLLKPGDMVVQRATMHRWHNPHPANWARMVAIMTECQPVEVKGETLGTYFPNRGS